MILHVNIWKQRRVYIPTQQNILEIWKNYCIKIAPYVDYYKKQIDYYNQITYEIITNELALILPTFPKTRETKEKYHYISYNRFYQFGIWRYI